MKFVNQAASYYQKNISAKIKIRILLVIVVLALFAPLFISIILPQANRYLLNRRISDLERKSEALASEKENANKGDSVEYVSNEILIKVKDNVKSKIKSEPTSTNTGIASLNEVNRAYKVSKFQKVVNASKKTKDKNHEIFNWYKVTLPGKQEIITEKLTEDTDNLNLDNVAAQNLKKIIAKFQADPNVETAELDYVVHNTAIPNDPYYSSSGSWGQGYQDLYGMHKINAAAAWDQITDATSVIVANIDTGVDRNHEDIRDNMWVNTGEVPGNGIDDDGNGYRDDYYGWDWVNNDNDPMDDYGHGTHTAGTIAAKGNNGIGVVGVAWAGRIMALKFLNSSGSGSTSHAASALRYAADMGAKVSSNSWGCKCTSSIVADAVSYEHNAGVVIVASAGNNSENVQNFSPASLKEVITVAASNYYDVGAYFSNFGSKIDVAAPGENVLSLKSAVSPMCTSSVTVGTNYCRVSGTSMAAPHVAGLAALILTNRPQLNNEEVRQVLRISADDIGSPGFDVYTGHGCIDAGRALNINSTLSVEFYEPFTKDLTNLQSIEIRGTAAGAGFASYELSYGKGVSPSSWTSISSSSSPVTSGVLGNWQVGTLEPAHYVVRLIVIDTSGNRYDVYHSTFKEKWVSLLKRNYGSQKEPRISGQKIVWWDTRSDNGDVYLYDVGTNTERRITTNSSGQFSPDISGDKIVWYDDRNGPYDIYLYDLATNTERQITDEAAKQDSPRIFGDKIVWEDLRDGSYYNIYLYDLNTNTERQITNESESQLRPSIHGDKIVWYGYHRVQSQLQSDIFLYDLSTNSQKQITKDSASQSAPDIWGDKIVWWEYEYSTADLILYDLANKTKTIIADNIIDIYGTKLKRPTIYENTIAWSDTRNGNHDVFLYDISTNTEKYVTAELQDQTNPAVFGENIVWSDYRDSSYGYEIYWYDPPSSPDDTTPPTAPSNLAATAVSSSQINLSWTVSTDNVGVTGYEIYRDSSPSPIATVTTTSYNNTGLSSSTTYSYFVKAKDEAGNRSSPSNTASATTFVYDIEAPSVNPVSPENGSIVTGNVNVSATATDNVGVTKVEFSIDGVLKYTDTTEPYGFTWDSTSVLDGTRTVTYKAYDAGNRSNAKNRTITVDNTAPTVSVTDPSGGSVVSGTTTIAATASDSTTGVVKVEFLVNGVVKGQDTTSPYIYAWDTTTASDGTYTLSAKAFDSAANTATSSPVNVNVDNTDPTVSMTAPTNGQLVAGSTTLTATAADNNAVIKVEFLVDGILRSTDSSSPYSWDWVTTSVSDGSHTLSAKAYDAAGNTKTDSLEVTVDNTKPNISITEPTNGFIVSGTIVIGASASDTTSGVAKVEFLVDGVLKSTDTSSPYSYSWDTTTTADGSHTLTAKAYDVVGNTDTDVIVTTVDNTDPAVFITSPADKAMVLGTKTITANASDITSGVSKVEFYVDEVKKSTGASSPYSYSWDTTTTADGNHTLTAKAYDAAGNIGLSSSVSVTVDNTKPIASISSPTSGKTVSSIVTITATANDVVGVTKVEFYVGNTKKYTDTASTYTYKWDTTKVSNSQYKLLVKAYDEAGYVGTSSEIPINVYNEIGTPKRKLGDLNGDGKINIRDLSILLSKWAAKGTIADLNTSGRVDIRDLSVLLSRWGK